MNAELETYKETVFEMYKEASRAGYYMQMVENDHYIFYKFADLVDLERHKNSIDIDLGRKVILGSKTVPNKKIHLSDNFGRAWYIDEHGKEICLSAEQEEKQFWESVFTLKED